MRISDWSSDVCSSDLEAVVGNPHLLQHRRELEPHGRGRRHADPLALEVLPRLDVDAVAGDHEFRRDAGAGQPDDVGEVLAEQDRQVGRRSEEHTSALQSLMRISYAVFSLKKKKNTEQ